MKKAAVVGGTGYAALELIRILENHPFLELTTVISQSEEGNDIAERYPHLHTIRTDSFKNMEAAAACDVIFLAAPAGVASKLIPALSASKSQIIDLSGDLRLEDSETYEKWYGLEPPDKAMQQQAVYGLPEVNRESIRGAKLLSNPGCFATAAILGMYPAVKQQLIEPGTIMMDGKTGVSGAGRKMSMMTHFSETNENIKAYRTGAHQHVPEIEEHLGKAAGIKTPVYLQTHLMPMTRGIMVTSYGRLACSATELQDAYKTAYEHEPFTRYRISGPMPQTKDVYGSSYCDIGVFADERSGTLMTVAVIDNLMKGAAGQAVQNCNIMNDWPEHSGLQMVPQYP
ncbi:N-acetyl-gamma-glutamyl-phosphate reductase [Alkalicoccus luteus]|uniref:N-acetyl-gamma-glutamyl-phosphate reductase n=1 Tax=Alkalicoccus luteus TaxID=1237094 RepID=A0A969TUF9_9BACI|nr:N-acetyl-gamma-glutamyl-phosphate reductase [Alkalicoccus luteus]NJP37300.1 N-acetyl-gamma-glutamyl-phosphate reductase [Alkalicoccus luteus]